MNKRISTKTTIATAVLALLVACGGGGSGSSSSAQPSPNVASYQAGISIGDLGDLTIDYDKLTYRLYVTSSSFGLSGQTLEGELIDNGDGTYKVKGTNHGTVFVYPNYAIIVVKIDPDDPQGRFDEYFKTHPYITQAFYAPVFSLNKERLLSTTDQVTSNLDSLEFRSASFGFSINGDVTNYASEAARGQITKISDTSFSVSSCSNDGASANNSRLRTGNCTDEYAKVITFTYDEPSKAWLVSPKASSTQSVKAYFVNDTQTNHVVGYIDTSDTAKLSSKFAVVTIVPRDVAFRTNGNPSSFTSYQACSSSENCAGNSGDMGIDFDPEVTITSSGPFIQTSTYMSDGPCSYLISPNMPANGYMDAVYYDSFPGNGINPPNGICTKAGDKPDNIMFFFGSRTVNGKLQYLAAMAGYDKTVPAPRPSQKFSLNFIVEN